MDIALLNTLQGSHQASVTSHGSAGESRNGTSSEDSASPFASLLGKARGGSEVKRVASDTPLPSKHDTLQGGGSDLAAALGVLMQDSHDAKLLSDWLESGDASQLDALTQRLAEIQQTLGGDTQQSDSAQALAALLSAQMPTTGATSVSQGSAGALANRNGDLSLGDIQQRMLLIQQSSSASQHAAGDATSHRDLVARLTNAATNADQDAPSLVQLIQNAQHASGQAASQTNGQASPTAALSITLAQQAQAVANAQGGEMPPGRPLERQGDTSLFTSLGHNATSVNASASGHANAAASAAGASATATLTPQVGMAEWGRSLGQQVVRMAQRGDQQVELRLHPAELGPLSVSLKMGDQQQANVQFFSAHGAVRHALEAAIPQLREALADSGIALGETSVGEQDQFQQQPDEQQDQPGAGNGTDGGLLANESNTEMPLLNETPLQYIASSGINLYA
ncbi:flagellar hook-length control protein FliK [Chromohalobacter marismortui]|uniref:Flagellar hook-length control protein FliK n=1 Tax=Chromohalobacter marismortui TaxID=42055 RepID=A0A4R7NQB3_9GAMM|nr:MULTISPECIES: flagellar hook-length control protein FliK [Chromohalobacter]MCI0508857.1 flagellar hook-length control protein FliK [Chromohalobacter sp.]MCI0594286.1 flagellar hook-length control protein FliK [Chromohalobacter sp.]TDU22769.1 flagellar hook-length control protein FliK [Chromohalobacter marismortui]